MSRQNAAQKLAASLTVLAKAATPGPWVIDGDYVNEHDNVLYSYIANGRKAGGRIANTFANCLVKTDEQCRVNAAFIAGANPKAVLVLTAEIDRLKAENEVLREDPSMRAIRSLRSDCEDLRKDAERYRWLRRVDSDYAICTPGQAWEDMIESHLDAQVDASITSMSKGQANG